MPCSAALPPTVLVLKFLVEKARDDTGGQAFAGAMQRAPVILQAGICSHRLFMRVLEALFEQEAAAGEAAALERAP